MDAPAQPAVVTAAAPILPVEAILSAHGRDWRLPEGVMLLVLGLLLGAALVPYEQPVKVLRMELEGAHATGVVVAMSPDPAHPTDYHPVVRFRTARGAQHLSRLARYMVWGFGLGVLDGILEVYLARADSELGSVSFWIFLGLLFSAPVTLGLLRIRMSLRRFPRVDMSRGVPQLLVSIETLLWAGLITGAAMSIALLALDLLGRP